MTTIDQGLRRDSAFKLFVHHQTFIRHLLRAYPLPGIDEREVVAIDAGNANLVAPHGQGQRLADAVWRLTLADGEIAYLLIECQAKIDPSMPFRMLHASAGMYLILSQLCWPQHNEEDFLVGDAAVWCWECEVESRCRVGDQRI